MKFCLFFVLSSLSFSLGAMREKSWAEKVYASLTLEEKIAQCMIVRTVSNFDQNYPRYGKILKEEWGASADHDYVQMLIEKYRIGGLIFLLYSTIEKHYEATYKFQSKSKYPLLMCFDAENGLTMRLDDGLAFPWPMTLGALQDESLIYEMGKEVGIQCYMLGIDCNFAPVADVNNNPKNPIIAFRSFGDDPKDVARKSVLYMKGLQDGGIIACGKHFPGHGDTEYDSHETLPRISATRDRLIHNELISFAALIEAGVDGIMTAHLQVPALDGSGLPTSLSPLVVNDLLKKELGFKGLVFTDSLEMGAVTKHFKPGEIELKAFLAGNDLLVCPQDVPHAIALIKGAVESSEKLQEQLNERVLKILRIKEKLYLHREEPPFLQEVFTFVHRPEAMTLKKKLFARAITLLRNDSNVLPLREIADHISLVVAGKRKSFFQSRLRHTITRADAFQSLSLLKDSASDECDSDVEKINNFASDLPYSDAIIYAIFSITQDHKNNYGIPSNVIEDIQRAKAKGKKVITVLFGFPYSASLFGNEDALIMAYDEDRDAQEAAADVILGRIKPLGKLPVTVCEKFPRGTGLTF